MATPRNDPRTRTLRLWPGIAAVALQWLAWGVVPLLLPEAVPVALLGAVLGGVAVVVWWLFFSRAPWLDRLLGVTVIVAGYLVTPMLLHESVATGAQGALFTLYFAPIVAPAFVAWAILARHRKAAFRYASMVVVVLGAFGSLAMVRTFGVNGAFDWDWAWRWSSSHEERLVASGGAEVGTAPAAIDVTAAEPTWPGFRGPGRDGVVRGTRLAADWTADPPVEIWRRPIGPAWSSFAVAGDLVYTQEQRGEEEILSAYSLSSGEPVWMHADRTRFWEAMSGPGPRGTPTLDRSRVYSFGATGILNAVEAATGEVVWSRDTVSDTGATIPGWGLASSPLVFDDRVIVAVAGQLAAYDRDTGEPRWVGEAHGDSYASPHRATIEGDAQVLLMTGSGVTGVSPATGAVLWEHEWPGFHSLQPARTADGDLLIASSGSMGGVGTRRIAVRRAANGWSVEERWTSIRLKPYYNDFVVHEGHAYGFDGGILAAMDVADGSRAWKGGRYGHGQLLLLADQDLLLVITEEGEIALVDATPDRFNERARHPALEGKTWNHPVLVDDVLLLRNGTEMAAFRLTLQGP